MLRLGTIFYLSYLAFEYPQNLALQRFPVGKWMSLNIFVWAVYVPSIHSSSAILTKRSSKRPDVPRGLRKLWRTLRGPLDPRHVRGLDYWCVPTYTLRVARPQADRGPQPVS
jgi:hypothetical protein